MWKKILAIVAMLYAAASFAAAVDVNKATAAELDGLKGIGPGISGRIIDERKKGEFKDWNDFIERVKGVGNKNAATFSSEGMTVNGASFKGAPAVSAAKATAKPADAPAAAAAPAPAANVAASDEKKDAKADAKARKTAKAQARKKKADDAQAAKTAKAATPAASASRN